MSSITAVKDVSSPRHMCSINRSMTGLNARQRRILRELHYTSLVMDKNSDEFYDPELLVYPSSGKFDIWYVFMKAPDGCPYEGKWYFLNVTFPPLYPIEPPLIRFVHVPYNLNVSREGRICMDILEKGYIASFHAVDIIRQIKEIFLIPRIETPIQIEILHTYLHNKTKYEKLARKSARNVGRDDFKDFFTVKITINDEVDDDFKIIFDSKSEVPRYMLSQISGRVYQDSVVLPSTGARYEREEIKQLINSSVNPICVITGKPITETVDDVDKLPGSG